MMCKSKVITFNLLRLTPNGSPAKYRNQILNNTKRLLLTLLSASISLSTGLTSCAAEEPSGDSNAPLTSTVTKVESDTTHVERHDKFITVDGAKLHYVEAGSGQAVILLHGNDGTLQDFTMSAFDLIASKYHALAFDRPGHGASGNPSHGVATPQVQAALLHKALKELNITHPIIVAHSWSGSMGLSYALQFPDDLSALVMDAGMAYDTKQGAARPSYYAVKAPVIGTVLAFVYKYVGYNDVKKQLETAFYPEPAPKEYVDKFCQQLFRMSQLKAAARDEVTLNASLKKMKSQYHSLNLPVVIICGDEDKLVTPSLHSYPLHEELPKSKLIVVKHAGHELSFTHPKAVLGAIDDAAQMASTWQK